MYKFIKRILDLFLVLITFPITIPVVLIISLIIKIETPGPVFFRQKRVGVNKSHFNIYKFRTMRIDTPKDVPTHLLENPEQFITKTGKFLRKTSLDEVPQLINIFVGDMSFVGPRPALWNQFDLIELREKENANRFVPGLTGLAQIKGRDELPLDEKAALDGEYGKNFGFIQDLKIFLATFLSVLKSDGVKEGR